MGISTLYAIKEDMGMFVFECLFLVLKGLNPNKVCVLTSWFVGDISENWVILGSASKFLIPFIGIIVSVVYMLVDVFHRVGLRYS